MNPAGLFAPVEYLTRPLLLLVPDNELDAWEWSENREERHIFNSYEEAEQQAARMPYETTRGSITTPTAVVDSPTIASEPGTLATPRGQHKELPPPRTHRASHPPKDPADVAEDLERRHLF